MGTTVSASPAHPQALQLFFSFFFSLLLASHCVRAAVPLALETSNARLYDDIFPNGTFVDGNDFPEDFIWGSLTWAVKHEGAASADGKGQSVWDVFALKDDVVSDGSTPDDGGEQYYHYQEDIKLMSNMGMGAYRFSIAWTRIYPNGTGEVNEQGIAHYNDLIDRLIEEGLEPYVSLYEQDLPQTLQDQYGGLLSAQFIDDFAMYANTCFNAFGDRVKHWITFDEPNDFIAFSYAAAFLPPGRCSAGIPNFGNCTAGNSSTEPYIVTHNVLLAHAAAVQIYRSNYQEKYGGKIGICLWFKWHEPYTSSATDVAAAERGIAFTVGWFLDPLLKGDWPDVMKELVGSRLPNFTEEQSASLKGSIDFLGLTPVTGIYATYDDEYRTDNTGYFQDMRVKLTAYRDGEVIGKNEEEYIVPWVIGHIVNYIKERYDNFPMFVSQIGVGLVLSTNETLNDEDRVRYFASYFKDLIIAIRGGANVKGIFAWSLIDGFEFSLGLRRRFGIHYVDDDYNRYPRLSALWLKGVITRNQTLEISSNHVKYY